jgi:hypothetical protein
VIELLLPCGFDTLEYSWVKATIGICTLTYYSVAKKHQQLATPTEEALDKELPVKASGKRAIDILPTMLIVGECSSSIAQTNRA